MPTGRFPSSLMRTGAALALVLVLAACTAGGQFDPTEVVSSDIFHTKKKISGEREPLFPQGVPGAEQGVPPDLVKGYQPPPDQSADTGLPPAPATKATAAEKSKATAKPKPKLAAAPKQHQDSVWNQKPAGPTRISVGPAGTPAAPNAQAPAASSAQTPWPAPPPTAPGQQAGQSSQSVWPNPPAPAKATQ